METLLGYVSYGLTLQLPIGNSHNSLGVELFYDGMYQLEVDYFSFCVSYLDDIADVEYPKKGDQYARGFELLLRLINFLY
jgi:hypothetical protein